MGNTLAGQVALITGAARGIGQGIAREMAREGASLCVNDVVAEEAAAPFIHELQDLGVRAIYVRADVRRRSEVQEMADRVEQSLGPITVLVSNAITSQRHPLLKTSFEELQQAVEVGVYGAFHLFQVIAGRMVEKNIKGSIIQMTSPWAYIPYWGGTDYRVVKAAQHHMALSFATEMMWHGIRVNLLEPGWTDTPGEHRWFSDQQLQEEAQKLPLGRLCTPEDVGRAAVFLAREPYIVGAHIKVDGGLTFTRYGPSGVQPLRPE